MDKNNQQQSRGFLITCDKNKEKMAIKDAYNFLNEYIEHIYGDLETAALHQQLSLEGKEISLANQIEARGKLKFKVLSSVQTNVNCVVFIKIHPKLKQVNPNVVVLELMKDVHKDDKVVTRFCHKIVPVEKSFKAEHFRMLDEIDGLFQTRDNSEVKSWALNFKCRNNSKFSYKEVLAQTQKIAKKYGHFVDIYYPQWTVSVQIVNHLMCLSIVDQYKDFMEYRLHKKLPNVNSLSAQENREKDEGIKSQKRNKNEQGGRNKHKGNKRVEEKQSRQRSSKVKQQAVQEEQVQQNIHKQEGEKAANALLQEKIEVGEDDDIDFV